MGRYEQVVAESVARLESHGRVVGPSLEAQEWRRRMKGAARQRGWRLATGTGATGYPWAARIDLADERGTPCQRLGLRAWPIDSRMDFPPAEHRLVAADAAVLGDLDEQVGVDQPDPLVRRGTERRCVLGAADLTHRGSRRTRLAGRRRCAARRSG